MDNGSSTTRRTNSFSRTWTLAATTLLCAVALLLASCAEDPGDTNSGGGASGPANTAGGNTTTGGAATGGTTMSTMAGTTGGTTMGNTTGGTTMSGTTMGGSTTMGDTTSGGTTMGTTMQGGTTGGGTAASGSTITSLRAIASSTDKGSLAGRQARLEDVEVRSSIGDTGFLVGASGARQLFVVPGGAANVQQGQSANIEGTLEEIPNASGAQQQFGLSETEAALLQSQVVYLSADQVQ